MKPFNNPHPSFLIPHPLAAWLWNILLVYLLYMLSRVVYVWEFWDLYGSGWSDLSLGQLLAGALRFDTSAIAYTNALFTVLFFLPLAPRWVYHRIYQNITKTVYVAINALMLTLNLVDTVYSRYTGRRTTWSFFAEFDNEGNLGTIVGIELLHHWYLVLIGIAFIAVLIFLYAKPHPNKKLNDNKHTTLVFCLSRVLLLALLVPLFIIGMRGGSSTAIRPITISNANQYVNRPSEAAIVLNTPFSLIRTMGKATFTDPAWFSSQELDSLYSPVQPGVRVDGADVRADVYGIRANSNQNVVVLIVESMAAEYMGFYNDYAGYTPFLDSLAGVSLTFSQNFSNGRKSIDGMPSILSGIPMFVEPFFLTSYSLNTVSGLAGELSKIGYRTAFYHGAENGSMGFEAFARTTGFEQYYGRTEYNADPRFHGDEDFDGTWAIWDEPFLQFFALTLTDIKEPFMTALFTASSHHPFRVPDQTMSGTPIEQTAGHPMYRCIRYTDMALRHFFATASQQPWYNNTLFVITADHTNITEKPAYANTLGSYRVPILFFDPSGRLPRGHIEAVAQQTDIMPTILSAVGYPYPYVAFGIDLLTTPPDSTWALHYNNGIYQYVRQGHLLLFDGEKPTALYSLPTDPALNHNLLDDPANSTRVDQYTRHTKAIIQSYMQRMIGDSLTLGSINSP